MSLLKYSLMAAALLLPLAGTAPEAKAETVDIKANVQVNPGGSNARTIRQNADRNVFGSLQAGDTNRLDVRQSGRSNTSSARQIGRDNGINIRQRTR